jgi:uncharacterized RDD family membrane protein YckC
MELRIAAGSGRKINGRYPKEGKGKKEIVKKGRSTTGKKGPRSKKRVTVVGLGPRLATAAFDGLLLFILSMFVIGIVGFIGVFVDWIEPHDPAVGQAVAIVTGILVSIVYYVASWATSGQTPAKRVLGIKVTRADGEPLSVGGAFVRYIGYLVSSVALAIGFVWVAFDKKRQGWHDKLAGTYVVPEDAKFTARDIVTFVPADPSPEWVWLAIWVVLAVALPGLLVSSLFLLGPVVTGLFGRLLGG